MKAKYTTVEQSQLGQILKTIELDLNVIEKKLKQSKSMTADEKIVLNQVKAVKFILEHVNYFLTYFDEGRTFSSSTDSLFLITYARKFIKIETSPFKIIPTPEIKEINSSLENFSINHPMVYDFFAKLLISLESKPVLDSLLSFFNKNALAEGIDFSNFHETAKFNMKHVKDNTYTYTQGTNAPITLDLETEFSIIFTQLIGRVKESIGNYLVANTGNAQVQQLNQTVAEIKKELEKNSEQQQHFADIYEKFASSPESTSFDSIHIYNEQIKEINLIQKNIQNLISTDLKPKKETFQRFPKVMVARMYQKVNVIHPIQYLSDKLDLHITNLSEQSDNFELLKTQLTKKITAIHSLQANNLKNQIENHMRQIEKFNQFEIRTPNTEDGFDAKFELINEGFTALNDTKVVLETTKGLIVVLENTLAASLKLADTHDQKNYASTQQAIKTLQSQVEHSIKKLNSQESQLSRLLQSTELAKERSEAGLDKLIAHKNKMIESQILLQTELQNLAQKSKEPTVEVDVTVIENANRNLDLKIDEVNNSIRVINNKFTYIYDEIQNEVVVKNSYEAIGFYEFLSQKILRQNENITLKLSAQQISQNHALILNAIEALNASKEEIPFDTINQILGKIGYKEGMGNFLTVTKKEWIKYHGTQDYFQKKFGNKSKQSLIAFKLLQKLEKAYANEFTIAKFIEVKPLLESTQQFLNSAIEQLATAETQIIQAKLQVEAERKQLDEVEEELQRSFHNKKAQLNELTTEIMHLDPIIDLYSINETVANKITALAERNLPESFQDFLNESEKFYKDITLCKQSVQDFMVSVNTLRLDEHYKNTVEKIESFLTTYQETIEKAEEIFCKKFTDELDKNRDLFTTNSEQLSTLLKAVKSSKTGLGTVLKSRELLEYFKDSILPLHQSNLALMEKITNTMGGNHPLAEAIFNQQMAIEAQINTFQNAYQNHINDEIGNIALGYKGYKENSFTSKKIRSYQESNLNVIQQVLFQLADDETLLGAFKELNAATLLPGRERNQKHSVLEKQFTVIEAIRQKLIQSYQNKESKTDTILEEINQRELLADSIVLQLDQYLQERTARHSIKDWFFSSDKKNREAFVTTLKQEITQFKDKGTFQPVIDLIEQQQAEFPGNYLQPLLKRIVFEVKDFNKPLMTKQPVVDAFKLTHMSELYKKIHALKTYAKELEANAGSKKAGNEAKGFAKTLQKAANQFLEDYAVDIDEPTLKAFKKEFGERLDSMDDKLSTPRLSNYTFFGMVSTERMKKVNEIKEVLQTIQIMG